MRGINRPFGVEFETSWPEWYEDYNEDSRWEWIENNLESHCEDWMEDGGSYGVEFPCGPFEGREGFNSLERICRNLSSVSEPDSRCGTHVHLDIGDFDTQHLVNLATFWAKHEYKLRNWFIPRDRRDSIYCRPLEEDEIFCNTDGFKHCKSPEQFRDGYGEEPYIATRKFTSLNFGHVDYYGTVECRLLEGTLSYPLIASWVRKLQAILDFSMRFEDEEEIAKIEFEMPNELFSMLDARTLNKTVRDFLYQRYTENTGRTVSF
jgi:putative amidoligase enzyme